MTCSIDILIPHELNVNEPDDDLFITPTEYVTKQL